jgi:hemoglobin-like flavoprotein
MLLASLKWVIDNLRRPDVLVPMLERMGAKQVEYGAKEEHYPAVGASLVKSLAEVAGDAWTGEMAVAWSEALGEIAHHMLSGAAQPTN